MEIGQTCLDSLGQQLTSNKPCLRLGSVFHAFRGVLQYFLMSHIMYDWHKTRKCITQSHSIKRHIFKNLDGGQIVQMALTQQ